MSFKDLQLSSISIQIKTGEGTYRSSNYIGIQPLLQFVRHIKQIPTGVPQIVADSFWYSTDPSEMMGDLVS